MLILARVTCEEESCSLWKSSGTGEAGAGEKTPHSPIGVILLGDKTCPGLDRGFGFSFSFSLKPA